MVLPEFLGGLPRALVLAAGRAVGMCGSPVPEVAGHQSEQAIVVPEEDDDGRVHRSALPSDDEPGAFLATLAAAVHDLVGGGGLDAGRDTADFVEFHRLDQVTTRQLRGRDPGEDLRQVGQDVRVVGDVGRALFAEDRESVRGRSDELTGFLAGESEEVGRHDSTPLCGLEERGRNCEYRLKIPGKEL